MIWTMPRRRLLRLFRGKFDFMSDTLIYLLIAVIVGSVIYIVLGKLGSNEVSYESDVNEALDLSRECIKEAQETNRLLNEIKELLEKK